MYITAALQRNSCCRGVRLEGRFKKESIIDAVEGQIKSGVVRSLRNVKPKVLLTLNVNVYTCALHAISCMLLRTS